MNGARCRSGGGGESLTAILSVDAADESAALRLNDRVYDGLLSGGLTAAEISSLSPICPSDVVRRKRRQAWSVYWTERRVQAFRVNVTREAAALDFSDQAFEPFWKLFDGWRETSADPATEPIGFLKPLRDRFVHEQGNVVRVTTFVPDEPRCLAGAQQVRETIPSLRTVSRKAFSAGLSNTIAREVLRVSLMAAVLIVVLSAALIRRVGMVLLAFVPAVVGMVWGNAAMALFGLPLNISNLIAGIIVLGLSIDYGVCMVYAHRRGMRREIFRAVTLSALTTVLGAGVLLLARHPAFFSIGVTLVAGVSAGYLYAWLVLPAMQTLWPRLNPPEGEA